MIQSLTPYRRRLRYLRDRTAVGTIARAPFSICRSLGVNVPDAIYRHFPYHGVVNVNVGRNRAFRIRAKGHVIENRLYWRGLLGHEGECMRAWVELAQSARCVFDIGANTGLYSLAAGAVNENIHVHAFEPVPRIAAIIRDNAQLNESMNMTVHEVAVGDAVGEASLHDPGGDQPSSASLVDGFLDTATEAIEVKVITIDHFREEQGIQQVDLIKLDVEGVEELAITGMMKTIDECKPSILVEVLDTRAELMSKLRILRESGYGAYYMRKSGLELCETDIAVPENGNLLLIHKSRRNLQ
jgi:FkbM family methyltransferase